MEKDKKMLIYGILIGLSIIGIIGLGYYGLNQQKIKYYNLGVSDSAKYTQSVLIQNAFNCKPMKINYYDNQTNKNLTANLIAQECLENLQRGNQT